jgi:hypothetical protein
MLGWARRAWIVLVAASACAAFGFAQYGSARSLQASAERPAATDGAAVSGAQISGRKIAMEPGDAVVDGAPHEAAPGERWPRAEGGSSLPRRLQDTRVTVLLWMAPGSYGIRRGHPTADPILCLPDGCYVSRGPELSARFFPGRRALGFANTWGGRAGACRNELACVFRDIDLGRLPGYLQPVDLHILKHDRRRGLEVVTDSSCRLERGRLVCDDGLIMADYTLWIVPESLAAAAGPAALWRALAEALERPRAADLVPR